eukprot:scaffold23126_cov241-Isochrysis_galbana.AAC.6
MSIAARTLTRAFLRRQAIARRHSCTASSLLRELLVHSGSRCPDREWREWSRRSSSSLGRWCTTCFTRAACIPRKHLSAVVSLMWLCIGTRAAPQSQIASSNHPMLERRLPYLPMAGRAACHNISVSK